MPPRSGVTLGPIKDHYETMLDNLSGLCWEEKMCDITFICMSDNINIHAHSGLLKNVSKLIKDTQVYLLTQPKLFITLEGVLSNTVHILLQFLYIGKIQLKETDADNLHALCQMLKIDFGEEMVSVLNKDNMEIYPQPGTKPGTTKPKPQPPPSPFTSTTPTYPSLAVHTSPKIPVNIQSPNSLKMTIKTSPGPTNLNKSPHAPKSLNYPQKYVVMPKKRKVETPTSPNIVPYTPTNPKPYEFQPKFDRRASSSSISSNNSVVRDTNLYCYCRKPTSKDLIGCDHCPQWYHPACLNLSEDTVKAILNLPAWKCPECEKKSALAKKAKLAKQGPLYLPIPNGAKFCEIKATRLDTWGTDEYEAKGFIPLDRTTWVSFDNTGSLSPVPPVEEMEIPPLPEDLASEFLINKDKPEKEPEQPPKSQIVQDSFPPPEGKPDRMRPSEVLNKKGVQAPTAKLPVEKPIEIITPTPLQVENTENPAPLQDTTAPVAPAPVPQATVRPVVPAPVPQATTRPVGRPRQNREVIAPAQPVGVVEPMPLGTVERTEPQPATAPVPAPATTTPAPQTAPRTIGRPRQRPIPQVVPEAVTDKPKMSTSEAAVERMKNEMRVAAEFKLIEEAERIREEAARRTKQGKTLSNGSKNTGPASRRGRRPNYRPPVPVKTGPTSDDAEPEVKNTAPVPEQPQPTPVPEQPQPSQQLKVKGPRGRRSSPNVRAQAPAAATLDEHIVKNIKKEKVAATVDEQIVKNIKKEKVTDHSMEEILSRDANELNRTKPVKGSRSLSNQNPQANDNSELIPEENVTNTSPEPGDNKPDEENNADSSKNEVYDELFFCYICKSIYVSKKALAAHQKSAHSK